MPPKTQMPIAFQFAFGIIWLTFMCSMVVGYIMMVISWWRGMKAHESIADSLSEIAQKLPEK